MVCVNVRSHIRAPACTHLHPLTPTCTRSHISHFHTHFQKFFCKTKLRQPHHAHCTHFARVRVCGRAKFRTSALSHTFPKIFLQKLRLGAQSVTLLSTLRDPTQLRRHPCAFRKQPLLFVPMKAKNSNSYCSSEGRNRLNPKKYS